jgi:FkbM family methyltransferase
MNIAKIVSSLPPFFRRHKIIKLLLLLSPNSRIQKIQFNGSAKLLADISDPNPRNCLIEKSFEPEFFAIAKPFMTKGGVFFDIGANFGFCSFGLIGYLPNQKIEYHLFEANPDVYKILLQSADLHREHKITVNNCCVTSTTGTSKLKVTKNQLGMSFISNEGDYEVSNLVIDKYVKDFAIQKIDFIKMDIEGWEPYALEGGETSLKNGIVDALYIEISSINLLRNGFCPENCFEFLSSVGFQLFYCKHTDLGYARRNDTKLSVLNINGHSLKTSPISRFPTNHQTDILAIHKKSKYLKSY